MSFDPYHRWLGIPPSEQPASYYRLLGIAVGEPDLDVIESAADRQMAHVRSFAGGPHSAESQRLLNELSTARLCLLNPKSKAAYDRSLEQAAVRAGPVHQVIVPVPVPVPVLKPVAVASPVAEPAMTPESVAAIRTLAELRARTAFYRLLNRTLWTIGALASCAVGIYLISQQPQVDQRTTVIDAPPQPPIYVSPREARTVVRPSIDVVQKIEPVQKKAEPGPTTPKPVKVEVAPALTATTFEKVEEPRDDRPFFILPEPDKPTSAEDLAAWQEKTFADRIAQAIGERAPKNPSHTWLVHALGVCFRSPIERHETFAEITRHLGETIDGSTPEGRKVVLALKRFSGGADQQRSVRKATEREKCVKKCRDASRKALVQIAHRSK